MRYLWAKDNIDYGYRQGMNEVLAIVVYAFFQEVAYKSDKFMMHTDCQENIDFLIQNPQLATTFIFDMGHTFADVYWCFDTIM